MKKLTILFLIIATAANYGKSQSLPADPKVILITLDGLRWQELFEGADEKLINAQDFNRDIGGIREEFWKESAQERRKILMPFIWSEVVEKGQIYGNRKLGNYVNLTNKMWFSYPGYNEILTGKADDQQIFSNDKKANPNITILEKAQNDPRYSNLVVAFSSWEVFPYIINEERSKVPVNSAFEKVKWANLTPIEVILNKMLDELPKPWGWSVRLDGLTHNFAFEYLKSRKPKFLYVAYGDTDDFAHDGDYSSYLRAAHYIDGFIQEIWDYVQSDPFYKDQTLLVITTDHGRGTQPLGQWKSHGKDYKNSDQVWMIFMGAGVKDKGEIDAKEQLYSNMIAPTILEYLKLEDKSQEKGNSIQLSR